MADRGSKKRALKRAAPERVRAAAGRSRGGLPAGRTIALAVLVAVAAMVAWVVLRGHGPNRSDQMPDARAYHLAARAAAETSATAAVIWYERGVARFPESFPLRLELASALAELSFAVEDRRGQTGPVVVRSEARGALARRALGEYQSLAESSPGRPEPHLGMAQLYATWGMSAEALDEFDQAFVRGDREPRTLRQAALILNLEGGAADTIGRGPR